MNPLEMFIQASWVGKTVIVILTGLSIYSIAVMIDKFRSYKAARNESLQFLPIFVKNLRDGNFQGALDAARKYKKSHIAKVVSAGLIEYDNDKVELKDSHDLVGAVGRALDRAVSLTSAEMKKGTGGLATIGSSAPFIGLFGTVMGILFAFLEIAPDPNGPPRPAAASLTTVGPHIAEALFATAIGLVAAIPAVMAYNYFTRRIRVLRSEMDTFEQDYLNIIKRHFLR